MCWNYQISLTFSALFLLFNSYYFIARPRFWKEYLLFGMFYFTMEMFQTLQWLFGNVYPNTNNGIEKCNTINLYFTIIAHTLIWLQPVLFSYIGFRTNKNKLFFKNFIIVNILILLWSLYSLYRGYVINGYYNIIDSIYGNSTCTNSGITGHLVWRFKPSSIEYFPNYLAYLVMCSLSFIMYDQMATQIIGIGWFISMIFTKIILRPNLIEMASSWCLLSIIANFIIMVYAKITKINQMYPHGYLLDRRQIGWLGFVHP